jgi:hypothetical protein
MVAWDKAKGQTGSGAQRREIERINLDVGDTRIRLIGDVMPRYVYWLTTTEGKRMPVECLRFDRDLEIFNDSKKDPMKEIDEALYSDKPQFAYVCNAIDRKDGKIKLLDLRATIYKQIVALAVNQDYGNPADADNGYDVTIKKEKTGPLPQNVKYSIMPARNNSPLTEDERAAELYDLNAIFKRQTYEEQKEWLLKNTTYFSDDAGDDFLPESVDDLD